LNPIEELFEIKKFVLRHLKNEKSSPQYQLKKYFPRIHGNLRGKQFGVMQECVINNLEKGIKMGFYRDNLNKEFISRIYFSGITSIKDTDLFPTSTFDIPTLTDDYLEYHIRGIVTSKGRSVLNTILNSTQN
ncbi:MAG: TetR/AcrR family transcriptional regulator, partial [Flavobacteriaceae bacterium]|nr:TetR/AcrR family transcriptional regulator [Flavobacteriaceae bacterium]